MLTAVERKWRFPTPGHQRVLKLRGDAQQIFVNGEFSGGSSGFWDYTIYVNPYMVVRPEGHYTKHIYVNSQRIASKIGNPEDYEGGDPTGPGSSVGKKVMLEEVVEENFTELFGSIPDIEAAADTTLGMSDGGSGGEPHQYWFTADHLGSSAFVTDASGVAIQHLEYMAFGEVFVDQRRTGFGTPYKFNAKELDCESGYYYYEARYYDPRMARFLSVDPLASDFPAWTSYHYVHNNPLRYTDPTGMRAENIGVDGEGNVIFDDGKIDGNLYLVNSGAGEINSLEDLKANSTQLTRNHEWIGSKDQMVNYVKSQWKQSGNSMGHLLSVMDIKIGKNKSGFAVNAFKGRQNSSGEIEENANTLLDNMYLKINYKPDGENHHLSNPYNTRNALTHEKQHLIQGVRHMHRDLGWTPRTTGSNRARELEAIQVQRTMPSWNKTTPAFQSAIGAYEKRWQ